MVEQVYDELYQFTERGGQMSLPNHQYLLASEPSIMFATGSYEQAQWILPQVIEILFGRPLDYLFISHMESDECGGISLFLKKYPKLTIICSSFTARELHGFGFKPKIITVDEGKDLISGNLSLKFVKYPSEVHNNDGLLVEEQNTGIFYSSDLMFHHVRNGSSIVSGDWQKEVDALDSIFSIDENRRRLLKQNLSSISPKFIAAGHGSCTIIS